MAAEEARLTKLSALISPSCCVFSKHSKDYTRKLNEYWNGQQRIFEPMAFVEVVEVFDVVAVVKFCVQLNIDFCVRSGGNGDYSAVEDSLVIDMRRLNKVLVDPENKTASVQSGALLGDIDAATVAQGLVTPLGTASFVGSGGHLLDLGMGVLSRSHGFAIDNVIEYDIVLSNGECMKVNKKTHPDLFWSMKGFGANFGVVVEFKLRLYPIEPLIMAGHCYFSHKDAKTVFKHTRDFMTHHGRNELAIYSLLHISESSTRCFLRFVYNGEVGTGSLLASELIKTCPAVPLFNNIAPMSYQAFQCMADQLCIPGNFYCQHPGHFLSALSDQVIETTVDTFSELTPEHHSCSVAYLIPLGGAICDIPESSSPFLLRHASYWVGTVGSASSPGHFEEMRAILGKGNAKLEPEALEQPKGKVEEVVAKLAAIKLKYDPGNCFRHCAVNIQPLTNDKK